VALSSLVTYRNTFTPSQIIWLIGIGIAVSLLGDSTFYIVVPTQYEQLGITASQIGIVLSANRAIRVFLNSPYGLLIERIPRRYLLLPSLMLGGMASLLYTITGFSYLLAGRLLWGMAWSGLYLGATTVILDIADSQNRGRFIGRFQMWFFIGVGTSSLLGGMLFDLLGYTPTFLISAGAIFIVLIIWFLFLPETGLPKTTVSNNAEELDEQVSPLLPSQKPLMLPVIVAIGLHGINWLIFIGAILSIFPVLLEEHLGQEIILLGLLSVPLVSFTGGLSAFNTVISLLTAPLSGRITDQRGERWGLVLVIVILGIISLGSLMVVEGELVILFTMLNAVIMGGFTTQLTAIVGDYTKNGQKQGRTLGVMNTVGDIGGTAGPLLAYALLPSIGLSGLFGLSSFVLLCSVPVVIYVIKLQHIQN